MDDLCHSVLCPSLHAILPALPCFLPCSVLLPVLPCPALIFSVLAYPVLSYPVLPYSALSYLALYYPAFPCSALPCPELHSALLSLVFCLAPCSVYRVDLPFSLFTLHCRCCDLLCHDLLSALSSHLICHSIFYTALSVFLQLCRFP